METNEAQRDLIQKIIEDHAQLNTRTFAAQTSLLQLFTFIQSLNMIDPGKKP